MSSQEVGGRFECFPLVYSVRNALAELKDVVFQGPGLIQTTTASFRESLRCPSEAMSDVRSDHFLLHPNLPTVRL